VESRIADICWSRVYFEYRDRSEPGTAADTPYRKLLWLLGERLADATSWILVGVGVVNLAILVFWTLLHYPSLNLGCSRVWNIVVTPKMMPMSDCLLVWNGIAAVLILAGQGFLTWELAKYGDIDKVMYTLAMENVSDAARVHSPFSRNKNNHLIHLSYWLDMDDQTLVTVMAKGIGTNLPKDEKRAHLIDIKREHLIEQVCPHENLFSDAARKEEEA
jgi:hypothetical protein